MRIIVAPAKKMNQDTDSLAYAGLPCFIERTAKLMTQLKAMDVAELKTLWRCSDKLAALNFERLQTMDLYKGLTPAILSYEGIQYQYMSPGVFTEGQLSYIETHLRILSGFYGMLRPLDGIVPYRLEMQAKLSGTDFCSLYEFWGDLLAKQLAEETGAVLNLASKEYSKCISAFLPNNMQFITCIFGEYVGEKVVEKGTQCKMARGEMVRFLAEEGIKTVDGAKAFDRLSYQYQTALSDEETYVFVKS